MSIIRPKIAALSIFLLAQPVFATTFVNQPLGKVTQEAQYIVRGTVGESYSDWGKGPEHAIYTYTELEVTEVIKGNLSDTGILLREAGGSKDGVQMVIPGSATFNEGEDVVVLLGNKNSDDGSYDVPGLATGKYNVVTGENGELSLINSLGGGAVFDPHKDARTLSYNARIPLNLFRKVAQGVAVPEANQSQFKSSKTPPPPGAADSDEAVERKAQALANQNKIHSGASRWYSTGLLVGFGLACIAVALFFWAISSKL